MVFIVSLKNDKYRKPNKFMWNYLHNNILKGKYLDVENSFYCAHKFFNDLPYEVSEEETDSFFLEEEEAKLRKVKGKDAVKKEKPNPDKFKYSWKELAWDD
jgi:hypothetical protein